MPSFSVTISSIFLSPTTASKQTSLTPMCSHSLCWRLRVYVCTSLRIDNCALCNVPSHVHETVAIPRSFYRRISTVVIWRDDPNLDYHATVCHASHDYSNGPCEPSGTRKYRRSIHDVNVRRVNWRYYCHIKTKAFTSTLQRHADVHVHVVNTDCQLESHSTQTDTRNQSRDITQLLTDQSSNNVFACFKEIIAKHKQQAGIVNCTDVHGYAGTDAYEY